MLKPDMPGMAGMPSMNDAFDFMKKMWGGMNVPNAGMPGMPGMPGMVMPTFSVEEINKQIADLKAVEGWLNVNMNMLRATIQALEVQSATLTALQTMGKNFETAMKTATTAKPETASPDKQAARKQARARTPEAPANEGASKGDGKENPKNSQQAGAAFTHPMADAAAWWNMLQNQFKQAVGDAMSDEALKPARKPADTPSGNRKRKSPPG